MPLPLIAALIGGGALAGDAAGWWDLPGSGPNEPVDVTRDPLIDALAAIVGMGNIPIADPNFGVLLDAARNQFNTPEEGANFLANAIRESQANDPAVQGAYSDFTGTTIGSTEDALPDWVQGMLSGGGQYVDLAGLQGLGLTGNDAYNALLAQFGLDPESQAIAAANSGAASTNASANYMNAVTNAARQKADQAYQQGQLLVEQGRLDLAEQQFAASEYWTGVANDLSQRQFQLDAAATPASIATQMYGAQESALQGRGALQLGSANTYSGLASLLGDLATTQANMGINLLTNPRNATAAFLLGQGADPANAARFGQFNVQRLLGIDPAQIQTMIQSAAQAAAQAQATSTQPQQIDLQTFLNNLQTAAAAAAQPGDTGTNPTTSGGNGGGGSEDTSTAGTPPATTTTPPPDYRRPMTGTVTVQPNNPVVRQTSPAPSEPDRGPFVNTYIRENPTSIARALYGDDLLYRVPNLADDAELTLRRLLRN